MPVGLLSFLTKDEILDLHVYLENGDFQLPEHLREQHLPETNKIRSVGVLTPVRYDVLNLQTMPQSAINY